MKKICYMYFLLLFWPGQGLLASEAADIEIIVSAEKEVPQRPGTSIIDTKKYNHKKMTIPELLAREAGIHLTRYGGVGELGSISIRGSTPDEIQMTLDGIPLNTAEGGAVDLSFLAVQDLSKLKIHRGGQMGAFAGAIELLSKKMEKGFSFGASASGGSYNSFGGHQEVSLNKGTWGFLFSQSLNKTTGNYVFLDDNGTPFNAQDDIRRERSNNESTIYHPFFKVGVSLDPLTELTFLTHFIFKHNGTPGITSNQSDYTNLTKQELMTALSWSRQDFIFDASKLTHLVYARLKKEQFADLYGEIGLGGTQDNDNDTSVFGSKVEWQINRENVLIKPVISFQNERYRPEDFQSQPSQGSTSVRNTLEASLHGECFFFDKKLKFMPSFGGVWVQSFVNDNDPSFLTPGSFFDRDSQWVWNATGKVVYAPVHWLSFNGGIGYLNRFPTFAELFGDRGGVLGNPYLETQKGIEFDFGMSTMWHPTGRFVNSLKGELSYFNRHINDLILFEQQAGFARAENSGKALIHGIEASFQFDFFDSAGLSLNYTFQQAKDKALYAGRYLPGRPRHEITAELDQKWGKIGFTESLSWMDANYLDPLNTRVVDSRMLLSAGVSYRLNPNWVFSFDAKNLSNSQVVDVIGFPLPGRSFWGQLSYESKRK